MFRRRPKTVADNKVFQDLMVLARQDGAIRAELMKYLRLPPPARRAELTVLLGKLRLRGAPQDFENAVAYLLHDGVAATALNFLEMRREKRDP